MNRSKTLLLATALVALAATSLEAAPPTGAARSAARLEAAHPSESPAPATEVEAPGRRAYRLPVTIDLSDVKVDGAPAPLGAYLVRVSFDPETIKLVAVRGGESREFSSSPVHTYLDKANQTGQISLTALNTREDGPTGLVNVARLSFVERSEGGRDSVRTEIVSIVTPLLPGTRDAEVNVHPIAVAK